MDFIKIVGAKEHNLKNVSVNIPRDKFVVITGLSGSGKSSLAFDTIYAEGQRRYVESLSAYARQFLGIMEKPDVEYIEGLSPAISIDQKSASRNPRSTVGTVTEIYDYLRLLFARVGTPHCPNCSRLIEKQTPAGVVEKILQNYAPENEKSGKTISSRLPTIRTEQSERKIILLSPIVKDKKGEQRHLIAEMIKNGYTRARIDNVLLDLNSEISLDKNKKHTIEIVVDRIPLRRKDELTRKRLATSVDQALELSGGLLVVADEAGKGESELFSTLFSCPTCGISLEEIEPRTFSFNSPHGACPQCQGLGIKKEIDSDLIVPNPRLSIAEGAIRPWSRGMVQGSWMYRILEEVAKRNHFSVHLPFGELSKAAKEIVFFGTGESTYNVAGYETTYEGVVNNLERRYLETDSEHMRLEIERYMIERNCPRCLGKRLKEEALAVKIGGKDIIAVTELTIAETIKFFDQLKFKGGEREIAKQILKEIKERLKFLMNVGLSYITLARAAATLSGGEAQRIRLATQIGSGLSGVLYILDEPSIGLHQRDNDRLLATLKELRDLGNTVIVVEHDQSTIQSADWLIDVGPGAGEHGGRIVAEGTPRQVAKTRGSITGRYLSGKLKIPYPEKRRKGKDSSLKIIGARENNLKNITVEIPLKKFVCITGVSGSGKSSLVDDILGKSLSAQFHRRRVVPGKHKRIVGTKNLDKVIVIDQSAIGRTPRSNPATYTGVFTPIRELFAATPEARIRGYKPGRFSFNVRGGRCEACRGEGLIRVEMHFLPDVWVTCDECHGKRYNKEALDIHFKEKNIAEVLDMTVEEALDFFVSIPAVADKLQVLTDVGLSYIKLGQPATTLSGGEAQRIKLSTELARKATGKTLYILDEPTTGLHFDDIRRLLLVLHRLVDRGNTVLVIEHNLDVVKNADHLIDLGPEGGDKGGYVVAKGTPEEVAKVGKSYTGQFLKKILH